MTIESLEIPSKPFPTTFDIKGVSGDPITITKKCSMFLNYTDTKGKHRQYKLTNCYLCDNIRTPLVCATHLINQGFEIHLTPQGHNMVFPDKTMSTLTTQEQWTHRTASRSFVGAHCEESSFHTCTERNAFPMNQIERIDDIKTCHNHDGDEHYR